MFAHRFPIPFLTLSLSLLGMSSWATDNARKMEEKQVIAIVKKAKSYIKQQGKNKAIDEFNKGASLIFAIDFNGTVLASPIHPETVGTNQKNFKDASGVLVVQEEIAKAMAGGGWLKGRFRKNHITGQHECRKLYILPINGKYLIGSWYYYAADKNSKCLV